MRYYKLIEDGYLVSVGTGADGTEITVDEYAALLKTIQDGPTPPEGYGYRLKEDLTWELYELPVVEPGEEEAAEEDYAAALAEFGVTV